MSHLSFKRSKQWLALRCRIRKVCSRTSLRPPCPLSTSPRDGLVARPGGPAHTESACCECPVSRETHLHKCFQDLGTTVNNTQALYHTHARARAHALEPNPHATAIRRRHPRRLTRRRRQQLAGSGRGSRRAAPRHPNLPAPAGADESPEGREERGDMGMHALCGRVARVRALTVPPLLPPLQAEDLVEGPPCPPALQTLAPELRECARSRRSGCQHARTVRIQSQTSRGCRRASSEDAAARPRRYLSCGWLRRAL